MAFVGDDGYDYDRQGRGRSPRGFYDDYRRTQYLDPRPTGGLHRTRSHGHQPQPNIYIYNDQIQDAQQRAGSPYSQMPPPPPPSQLVPGQYPMPPPPQAIPMQYATPPPPPQVTNVMYPPSPGYRGHGRLGDKLVEDFAEIAIHDRMRSRSRGRSDVGGDRSGYYQWELARKERELEEEKRKLLSEKEWELRKMRDDEKRRRKQLDEDAEEKRIVTEYEAKQRKKAADAKEAELRLREKLDREKREQKEEEERMKAKFKQDEEDAKKREKEAWLEFERKRQAKEEKEKADKKAEKEKFEHEMRKRLESFGVYSQAQIDYMVDEEKAKEQNKARSRSHSRVHVETDELTVWRPSRPVYPKIHRDYIEIETLIYYGVEYEYDRDTNYIILKREMTKYETDVLFEHTRRIRAGDRTLLIEEPKKDAKNYAWYRKRDRSSSRVRKVGILEVQRK
ncbi:hypothetical protein LTR62_002084 [Meristemomyces frigidus]|uniref:Uncharacterized protein n=1 Tax=Meristemomyces frigidus TaxID=1508187 RepID=A0AAN7TMZ6_9PEZI|nr:hypothetical protein LTR62_002084 [Meristemomyces frigidus]